MRENEIGCGCGISTHRNARIPRIRIFISRRVRTLRIRINIKWHPIWKFFIKVTVILRDLKLGTLLDQAHMRSRQVGKDGGTHDFKKTEEVVLQQYRLQINYMECEYHSKTSPSVLSSEPWLLETSVSPTFLQTGAEARLRDLRDICFV